MTRAVRLTWLCPVEAQLNALLAPYGVTLDGFYYCPHHPGGSVLEYAVECECSKPAPGILLRAAADHGIAVDRSWMVGDILNDVEAAHRAGCGTTPLDNGNEKEWELSPLRLPDFVVGNMSAVAERVLYGEETPSGGADKVLAQTSASVLERAVKR